ncbi:MmyB family transcriptional regulator [Streptomyces physcomitrii]|uniref:MmyB-like transcription regulator ligand binding domain-containing protein n=1 Tax=Streptomyces physcomitrii TaxID=2724184 RepID=A0ABX1H5W0_9ACTN|nr:hypothetical protein [Streptomyces physcomitrii]NKI43752.1 hypothetical protein [Streptomyces physcomitrii]
MAHQASGPRPGPGLQDPGLHGYLQDYARLLDSVPHPSVVFDHRWDVLLANPAFDVLFSGLDRCPTAMPCENFLRFVLFHPDAGSVLVDREALWCLPMMANFARAVERDTEDPSLQSIRRDIAVDPLMEEAYVRGLPHWIRSVGEDGLEHDGAVRPLRHPDPRWGRTSCRVVGDTPRTLQSRGYSRLTLVLREPRPRPAPLAGRLPRQSRRGAGHLKAVPLHDR